MNLCHDELRRRQRRPESSLDSSIDTQGDEVLTGPGSVSTWSVDAATPAEDCALADTAHRVRQALQDLPELYRSVVILRHYEGLKFSEIAGVLEIPEGTVKSRMVEGLARLGRSLGPVLADHLPVENPRRAPSGILPSPAEPPPAGESPPRFAFP